MKGDKLHRYLYGVSVAAFVLLGAWIFRGTLFAGSPREGSRPKKGSNNLATKAVKPSLQDVASRKISATYGSLPLSFEPNEGQTNPSVNFVSHGPGYTVFLTANEAVVSQQEPDLDKANRLLEKMDARARKRFEARRFYQASPRFHHGQKTQNIQVAFEGANPSPTVVSLDQLPGKANYFIGSDPQRWHAGIPTYARVKYSAIYPGIDLIYYGIQGRLEFDFAVSPGANPDAIRLRFDAPERASITREGKLHIATLQGSFELQCPETYQVRDGKRISVRSSFAFREDRTIGFEVANYDHKTQLVIDPALSYSTYLGGSGSDYASGISVDSQGNAYIVGQTTSANFPTYNGYSSSGNSTGVAFVTELNPTGTGVLYSTYLGGTGGDWGAGIALDSSNNVYVTGSTLSSDFPLVNAIQTSLESSNGNAFVARIDPTQNGTASLVYSSYLGGGGNASNSLGDVGLAIGADANGFAYVTGQTASDSSTSVFPTTSSALQSSLASTNGNAFLTVVNTNLGGPVSLVYSTYLGGASAGFGDYGLAITVDNAGNAYLTGQTTSSAPTPFPTTSGAYQTTLNSQYGNVFVTEIATTQSASQSLVYSTYLGGSSTIIVGDLGSGIGLDPTGKIYVGGDTTSADFPVTSGAFQITNSPAGKAFVAAFDPTKTEAQSLVYSTLLGGTNGGEGEVINGLAVDGNGYAFASGSTSSSDFPTTNDAPQTVLKNSSWDAFLSELNPTGTGLLYSTYFGGSCSTGDLGSGVALDSIGNPYLAGTTCSTDFSVLPSNAFQTSLNGAHNAFIAKFALKPSPVITAGILPSQNANGWNNSAVTVTFTCSPGPAPIQSCSTPVMVRAEGANHIVPGTVVDTLGNTSTTTETVNLDMTPPIVSITSPMDGSSVSSGYLTITGSITDALSGPAGVVCHGVQAVLSGSTFTCNIQLAAGANSITVIGSDMAGNAASASITVTNTGASGQTNPPVITSLSPNQGGIGSVVTVSGRGFGPMQGSSVLMFNAVAAHVLSWSDSAITARVPFGLSPGVATAAVGGNGSLSNGVQFTVTQPLFVTPSQMTMLVGNKQSIQLLDENGVTLTNVTWAVNDPSIAQIIPPANGQPTLLQADALGITTLIGGYGNRTGTAQVTVLAAGSALPIGAIQWDVPSLGSAGISKSVQSVRVDENTPDLYIEDDGAYGNNGAIRALTADGQQKWIWPPTSSDKFPVLLAADDQGGAIYGANQDTPGPFNSFCYLGRMDETGNETWQYQTESCFGEIAIGPDGTIYLVDETSSTVITALDPNTGQAKFTVPLPGTGQGGVSSDYVVLNDPNYTTPPGYVGGWYCSPGSSIVNSSGPATPSGHGAMSVGSDGTIYVPFTTFTGSFDAEPCDSSPDPNHPGYPHGVRSTDGTWSKSDSLQLMVIHPDGSYSTQPMDSVSSSGTGLNPGFGLFESAIGRAISDGQGGALVPVSSTQALYHYTGSGTSKLGLPIIPRTAIPFALDDPMLLGQDGTAYLIGSSGNSYDDTVAAIDTTSGSVKWTASPGLFSQFPSLSTVGSDGSLAFEYYSSDFSTAHLAIAGPSGQVSPLFGNPDGSDAGPVIPLKYGFRLPSELTLGSWLAYQPDLSLSRVVGVFAAITNSERPESGGNPEKQGKPPLCHVIHCVIAPYTDTTTPSDPLHGGAPLREVQYEVFSLQNGALNQINQSKIQNTRIVVFESNSTNPSTGICDQATIDKGECQSPNKFDSPGFYTDDYTAGTSGPNTVTQQFFVDKGLVPVFWPQVAFDSNGFQYTVWYGAYSQTAEVNRVRIPAGAFIKQVNPDTQHAEACSTGCSHRQANGTPLP